MRAIEAVKHFTHTPCWLHFVIFSSGPQSMPTTVPSTNIMTGIPTLIPTTIPSTAQPSSGCTAYEYVDCDFSTLTPNVFVRDQAAKLHSACGLTVSAKEGSVNRDVNVFNSSDVGNTPRRDVDLGSPNRFCPGGGPGNGDGGKVRKNRRRLKESFERLYRNQLKLLSRLPLFVAA